jgi:hypothetical protein
VKPFPKKLFVATWFAASVTACAASIPQWSMHEIALESQRASANPYTNVEVAARFTGPGGVTKDVRGFWDGGLTFKVRFAPTARGEWTYTITSKPADAGLAAEGAFTVTAPLPGGHGFLRRDTEFPTSFVFDDGTRFFMVGTTYYDILLNARAGDAWKESVTNITHSGMNKVRMHLHPGDGGGRSHYAASEPFVNGDPDRLDLAHWQAADRVVAFMAEHGVLADLIVFPYRREQQAVASFSQDERYLRYVLARYGAFTNVIWCLVNEWNYSVLPQDYWNRMGRLLRDEDPWSQDGGRPRALSIHQQTRPDWNFAGETWPSHAIVQFGVRNRGASVKVGNEWKTPPPGALRFTFGDDWGNHSIVANWTGTYPIVNDEYGYVGEPHDDSAGGSKCDNKVVRFTRDKHRRTMWGIAVGGGYLSTGDKNDYPDGRPYFSANWHDTPEYGDVNRLVDFFTIGGLEYWKMAPHNELVTGTRVYLLAEPDRQYVAYVAAGGEFKIKLGPGRYIASRFDPATGEGVSLGTVDGGERVIPLPAKHEWVVRLARVP